MNLSKPEFGEPGKERQVRDGKGNLLGYISKNWLGITTVRDRHGSALGWSTEGPTAYTMSFKRGRVAQGENPEFLFGEAMQEEEERKKKGLF